MKYFNFPKEWINSRNIPKEVLYRALDADEKLKKLFIKNVDRIRLEYLINYKNSNIESYISENKRYEEIHFYTIELRKSGSEEKIAKILHELVPKATIIEIKFGESFKISTSIKNIKDNSLKINYLETTEWLKISENEEFINSLNSITFNTVNLKSFYESIVDRVKANKVLKTIGIFSLEDIEVNNQKAEKIIFIQKEFETLKKELNNEKHVFKRAEIVKKIKKLNNKLK